MASRGLGSLTLDLIAKIGGFVGPLSQAERELDKKARAIEARSKQLSGAIGSAFSTAVGKLAGFAAGFVSVNAVFDGLKGALDNADKLDELSARLGISTEKLSTLGYAAQLSGSSLDDLAGAFPKLAKNIAEAADASSRSADLFKALGINIRDAAGGLRSADDLLPEIADKFKVLDNQTTETALAMELFGKSGGDLLEFLNRGSDGMRTLEGRARALGLEMDSNTASAAASVKDEIDNLHAALQGAMTRALIPMLPVLKEIVGDMTEFARSTDGARESGEQAAGGVLQLYHALQTLVGYGDSVRSFLSDLQGRMVALSTMNDFGPIGGIRKGIQSIRATLNPFYNVQSGTSEKSGQFGNVVGGTSAVAQGPSLQGALDRHFGGAGKGSAKKAQSSGGKSDAEREAEALKRQVDALNGSMAQQIALYGQTTEVAKVRWDLEHGELAKASQADKDAILLKAQVLDQMKSETDYEKQLADIQRDRDGVDQMIADMQFELDLIGRSNAERAVEIALRQAGKNATDEQRDAIVGLTGAIEAQRGPLEDQINLMDDFRSGAENAITDFVSGTKSMKDAFKDFANDFAQQITRLIAKRWIEQLFGQQGTTGSGTSGGSWVGSLLGAIFGGGKAGGGPVRSGTLYQVNEHRPEMLSVGGRDFLMMGASSGRIHPNPSMGGGGAPQTFNFNFAAPTDMRTQQQVAARAGFESRRAMARNG